MLGFNATFSSWLNRPYLDLGPAPAAVPNHTAALEVDCRSLFDDEATPWFWSSLNMSFREALVADVQGPRYGVDNPLDLPPDLRTERWQRLCEYLAEFPRLPVDTQVKVARLLNRMCFFGYTRSLVPADVADRVGNDEAHAGLAWLRAMAGYKLWIEEADTTYQLAEFEHIARNAPPGLGRINALYQMVAQNVKHNADLDATVYWQDRHQAAIEEVRGDLDPHDRLMADSRSHRVAGFIPQMRRDRAGTEREMDLAEDFARQMDSGTPLQRAYARELLYPVLESRIKEALWIRDRDLALRRALDFCDEHPVDARVWVECGQVYLERDEVAEALGCFREAVRLSPPGGEVSRFMMGQCQEVLGDLDGALDSYLAALRVDPLGISAAEGVRRVAEALGSAVRRWAVEVLNDLAGLREAMAQSEDEDEDKDEGRSDQYRHLPAPLATS